MILKITDLQNYTQFINTQPLNKNVKININVMTQAGETQIIGDESPTGPASGAVTAATGGGTTALPSDLGISNY